MKLRYLRVRNVLSFGDEDTKLEFGPFNVIGGPNDSGKRNLFRGDSDKPMHLEVCVELDETERELLATIIICSEIISIQRQDITTDGIKENKHWKNILIKYGTPILSKSFRCISFVLLKGELRISEPKMEIQLSEETDTLYIDRQSNLSEISQEHGGYQHISLTKEILKDFNNRFGNLPESDANSLLEENGF